MKKRVCLTLPTLQPGGMERVMSELACYFSRRADAEVHLILYGSKATIFYELDDNVIVHIPEARFNTSARLISTAGRLRYLRKKVKEINPDALLSFGEYWNNFVLLALLGLKTPQFVSDRCSPEKSFAFPHQWMRRVLYSRAKGVIAQTETAKQLYKNQFKSKNVKVIGNPITAFSKGNDSKELIVLTVGRLISTKNHDKLIESFCKIDKPGWKLVVVGGDAKNENNMERLKSLVKELRAEDKVILAGMQAQIEPYYLRSSIFAFSSTSEGFPNVLGEAMIAGLPAVAFDCIAGPSEMIVHEENGYLVPVGDYNTLKEKLELLMSDKSLRERMGVEARNSMSRFSVENIGEKYHQFILDQ